LISSGTNNYGRYGNQGNYKKLLKEFVLKNESPGKRFLEKDFLKKHRRISNRGHETKEKTKIELDRIVKASYTKKKSAMVQRFQS
jgi:hypothetical protein